MSFKTKTISAHRKMVGDTKYLTRKKLMVHAISDLHVTHLRKALRQLRKTGTAISLNTFVTYCFALALDKFPQFNSLSTGRTIYQFKEIDIMLPLEKQDENELVVEMSVLRNVAGRNLEEVQKIFNEAAGRPSGLKDDHKKFMRLPLWVRKIAYRSWTNKPRRFKQLFGTTMVSAFFGRMVNTPFYSIAHPLFTANLHMGNIYSKRDYIDGEWMMADNITITLAFDHAIVDAGECARFSEYFRSLVEDDYGLVLERHLS